MPDSPLSHSGASQRERIARQLDEPFDDPARTAARAIRVCCPACGSVMYPARLLKGYDKTGPEADRLTCALHGPLGRFRHIATDRVKKARSGASETATAPAPGSVGTDPERTPWGRA